LFGVLMHSIRRGHQDELEDGNGAAPQQDDQSDTKPLEIEGVDTRSGVRLTGGKRDRYEALLRKFAERQGGTVDDIRAALSGGDAGAAERAAHSLKGVAATLGAPGLAAAAGDAETAIRTGQDPEEALKVLAVTLDPVIKGIEAALPPEPEVGGTAAPSGDPSTVAGPLARLKQLLETDDGEAADFVIDTKSQLAGVLTPREIKTLSAQVGNFEFDAALESLSGIASRLSIDLGEKS